VSRSLESEAMTAIEFAVCQLKVSSIIVLGHQYCAGVKAIVEADDKKSMPIVWQEQHDRLCSVVQKQYSTETSEQFEKENIKLACHDLLTYPFITERLKRESISVAGWYFSLETGAVHIYDPEQKTFNTFLDK
jgi:carbonic anhydrase